MGLTSTLGVLALRSASVRFLAHYLAEGKTDKARSVVTRVLQLSLVTSVAMMTILFILAQELSVIFDSPIIILLLLPMCSALSIFYTQAQGFLQGLQKMWMLALISMTYTVVHYIIALVLVYAGYGILGIVISWLFTLALTCFISLFLVIRKLGFSTQTHNLKPLLGFSFPIYISTILTLIVGWVDQIIVFPFMGLEALGAYNLAVRASIVPKLVAVAIATSLFPKLAELHSRFGVGSLKDAFKVSTRYAAMLGFPLSMMVAMLAYPIIVLFATARFVAAVGPLAVMCIASLPMILGSSISPTFYTLKRTKLVSSITAISIVSEALLSFAFLAYFNAGLAGVAVSRLVAAIVVFALGSYYLRQHLKIEFDKDALWKSAVASIIMVASIFLMELIRGAIDPSSYQFLVLRLRQLPIYAIVGGIVYLLSLVLLRAVKKEDVDLLRDYLPSRLRWIANLVGRMARV